MSQPNKEDLLARAAAGADQINAILGQAGGSPSEIPGIPEPPDDLVTLPGGILRGEAFVRTAQVRELNGSDEEALSKALKAGNLVHFMDTLVTRGTVKVGSETATPELLKKLLIGDRDELALRIRIATYGETFSTDAWECPHCKDVIPLNFSLIEDVSRRTLNDASDVRFEVELRKGARAKVRLPNGADQEYLFVDPKWTASQRNSRLLERCVVSYIDPHGQEYQVVTQPSIVLNLGIPDRQRIVSEIAKRQPGPRYNEVTFKHEGCGNEVTLALGIADLFRDLILFL
jgi:hypothetical protein